MPDRVEAIASCPSGDVGSGKSVYHNPVASALTRSVLLLTRPSGRSSWWLQSATTSGLPARKASNAEASNLSRKSPPIFAVSGPDHGPDGDRTRLPEPPGFGILDQPAVV